MSPKVGVAMSMQAASSKIIMEKCPVDTVGWGALASLVRTEPREGCGGTRNQPGGG